MSLPISRSWRAGSGLAAVVLAALTLGVAPAAAQNQGFDRYEAEYGTPVEVSLEDLVHGLGYNHRAVRTKGRLQFDRDVRSAGRAYTLEDFSVKVLLVPVPEIASQFESDSMQFMGREVEVTGGYDEIQDQSRPGIGGVIHFWSFSDLHEEPKGPLKAADVSLEALLTNPGKRDGQTVRVVGKFRGRNLYGDLPAKSERSSADWVIKDDLYAVWITGKKPKGAGWELDSGLKRDTGKWIAVVGRPETRGGVTYLRALQVSLSPPPSPTAEAQAPPPPPPRPKVPPVVVFALPLDGEAEIARESRFVLQFSKDMDEGSFSGHVALRYVGPVRAGDRDLDGLRLTYDPGRRALTVDPGDVLRAGRELELLLLPGIADIDGMALVTRPGKKVDGAVDVLRFQIGG